MDQPPAPELHLIPYAQASPAQLAQALVTTREALDPYYPDITWPHWHQAFDHLRPALKAEHAQVSLTTEGLTKLAQYFEAWLLLSAPLPHSPLVSSGLLSADPEVVSSPGLPLLPHHRIKKTYLLHADVLESLNRVSFWRRKSKSALVNLALMRLLAGYSESQTPIPVSEV